jgi:hypothetical protein
MLKPVSFPTVYGLRVKVAAGGPGEPGGGLELEVYVKLENVSVSAPTTVAEAPLLVPSAFTNELRLAGSEPARASRALKPATSTAMAIAKNRVLLFIGAPRSLRS